MATPTYITTGDQRWNPELKRWEPIDSPLPNYHPTGGDPLEGPGAPLDTAETRARLAAAVSAFGGALPPQPPQQLGSGGSPAGLQWPPAPNPGVGGQQVSETSAEQGEAPTVVSHVVEGAELEPAPSEGEYTVDRLAELEPIRTRDTEPPAAPEPTHPHRRRL